MEADQERRLARIEMADDGASDLPVELLKRGSASVWIAAAAALAR
jgi:hypothetical protein